MHTLSWVLQLLNAQTCWSHHHDRKGVLIVGADEAGPSDAIDDDQQDDRDAEAEAELAALVKDDPLAAYDVDVRQEGLAIQEYLLLIQRQQQ